MTDSTATTSAPPSAGTGGCDAEPIHRPGAIQPPGILLVVGESDLTILQSSENLAAIVADLPDRSTLATVLGPAAALAVKDRLDRVGEEPAFLSTATISGDRFDVIAHRRLGNLIVELQPAEPTDTGDGDLHDVIRRAGPLLGSAATVDDLTRIVADEVRRITGYDRVMVYRFDEDWNGQVVGESVAAGMDPWLGLRYPASDIPAQARAMYVRSRVRVIADVNYRTVPINTALNPRTGLPPDLTFAVNRSVSPIHLEYLRNMNVGASMSVSVVRDDKLWGMILCHHRTPRPVRFQTRAACDLLAQQLALHLSVREATGDYGRALELKAMQPRLLYYMTTGISFADGLGRHADELLALADAGGVAVVGDKVVAVGECPTADQIQSVVGWLAENITDDVWETDALPLVFPAAAEFKKSASGLLAVSISRVANSYILWFRPEVFHTRYWAGDPAKPVEMTAGGQTLRPRHDFTRWKQTLEMHSRPWEPFRVEAAAELRQAAVGIVLRQAEEKARLATELARSNKELETFSYSVSHDLRAPFRHIIGFADLFQKRNKDLDETSQMYLDTIVESAKFAGTLVDGLLSFSQMGRATLRTVRLDLNELIAEARRNLSTDTDGRDIQWDIRPVPDVTGDPTMIRLVLQNLLSNAVKYTRPRATATIEIGPPVADPPVADPPVADPPVGGPPAGGTDSLVIVRVADNGVGFDPRYADKLFGVFQRLHRAEDFEGTGIGLANVRRIVERHGGRVWAEGILDRGATFYFSLPAAVEVEPEAADI